MKQLVWTLFLFIMLPRLFCQADYGSFLYTVTNDGFDNNYLTGDGLVKSSERIFFVGNTYQAANQNAYWLRPCIYEISDSVINLTSFQPFSSFHSVTQTKRLLDKDSLLIFSSYEVGNENYPTVRYFINTFNKFTNAITQHSYNFSYTRKYSIFDNLLIGDDIYTFGSIYKRENEIGKNRTIITKVNTDFEEQRFEIEGTHRAMPDNQFGSCLQDGNHLVISCSFYDIHRPESLPHQSNFWIFRMNTDGIITEEYRDDSDSTDQASQILKTTDGGYLAFGRKKVTDLYPGNEGSPFGYTKNVIAYKFDSLLNLQWTKRYGEISTNFSLNDGIITSDGNIVLAGKTGGIFIEEANSYDDLAWLLKINENGDILWERKYRALNDTIWTVSQLNRIIETSDGSLIALGTSAIVFSFRPEFGFNSWLLKTDENGCINPFCESITRINQTENLTDKIVAFPNPANESITFRFKTGNGDIASAFVTNTKGQLIQKIDVVAHEFVNLNLLDYNAGIYFIHLVKNGKRECSLRFIKL